MANLMDIMASLSLDASKFEQGIEAARDLGKSLGEGMEGVSNKLTETGSSMEKLGGNITKVGKAFAPMSAAAGAGLGMAIKTAAGFEAQMSKVSAISGVTGSELEQLTSKAREMGSKTKFSASEAGAAMEYMAMAGWKAGDMIDGIEGIMNLAAASGTDLATTSDIVTDALTGFGLTAEDSGHFAGVLAAASSNANTNVEMMGETFKYAAPLAGALGYSIEDVAVATGLMANSGIKAGQAGTSMRGWLTRLAKPTKESSAAIKALGLSMTDSEGNMKSFGQIIEETRSAFRGLTEDEKAQYAAMLAGQNGMSGLLAIVNATEADMRKLTAAVDDADGTAQRMAETMQDNLSGQLTILKSGMEEAAISIGDALLPQIKGLVENVQNAVNWFNSLDAATQSNIAQMLVFAAGIAPVTIAIGTLISNVGTIVGAIGSMGTALLAVNPVFLACAAAVVGISAALFKFNADANGLTPALEAVRGRISDIGATAQANTASIDSLASAMAKTGESVQNSGAPLEFWRTQLHNCFDSTGQLKEGCEDLAQNALDQLNQAMGTDYSLEFITQAKDSTAALKEIDDQIDIHIAKMKESALQTAFSSDYTKAVQDATSATSNLHAAEDELTFAVKQQADAANQLNAITNETWSPDKVARQREATAQYEEATKNVEMASQAFIQESENAARAKTTVEGLEKAMEELGKGGKDAADKATAAYGEVGVAAKKAGEDAKQAAVDAVDGVKKEFEVPLTPPKINQQEARQHSVETKDTMQGVFTDNPFVGTVGEVQNGEAAATAAHGEIQGVISQPVDGSVGSVTGGSVAAAGARSEIQSWLDQHPVVARVVKATVDDGSSRSYGGRSQKASGGFIFRRQDVTVGEAGPEVIIPLSANRRDRAINLFASTGRQLGLLSPVPEKSGAGASGGIVVNAPITVYGAQGQDVEELAEAVSEHINRQVVNSRRVWEGSPA